MGKEKKQSARMLSAVENFEYQRDLLLQQGYTEKSEIISVLKANAMAVVLAVPIVAAVVWAYLLAWQDIVSSPLSDLWVLLLFILSIPIHELLHGIGWSIFCKAGFRSVRFGVMWSKLTPYCSCKEPLGGWPYLTGGMLPLVVLGLIPAVLAIVVGNSSLMFFGLLGVVASGGDMMICLNLIKYRRALFLDHPSDCGFVAFAKDEG